MNAGDGAGLILALLGTIAVLVMWRNGRLPDLGKAATGQLVVNRQYTG